MTSHAERPTHRREFLGQLAGSAVVLAGTACVPASASPVAGAPTPAPAARRQGTSLFDDSWTTRLTARHKSVFDSPAIDEGNALTHASSVINGYREALGATDADLNIVIVIRHSAIPMAFNDAMWDKYSLGKDLNLKDPTTNELAKRNPFYRVTGDDRHAMIDPEDSLEAMHRRGVILLGCNAALMGRAYTIAQKTKADVEAVRTELRANLVPGLILQPNGVYAVARAQEMGCAVIAAS